MPRPIKPRTIEYKPKCRHFTPSVSTKDEIETVTIKLEELEAMRLKDCEGLFQEDCAKRMNVSRQTFQLILESARKKTVNALINGHAVRIFGGDYVYKTRNHICANSGKEKETGNCEPGSCCKAG